MAAQDQWLPCVVHNVLNTFDGARGRLPLMWLRAKLPGLYTYTCQLLTVR